MEQDANQWQGVKVDVTDYTGNSENYIFLNPSNGRMVIETKGIQKIYKFEVELTD